MNTIILEPDAPATVIADELDPEDEAPQNGSAAKSSPEFRTPGIGSTPQSQSATESRILARLLAMADSYREAGSLRQAMEIYFELTREHSETPQGHRAEERLFDVARSYERAGELRQARGIYEQLI